MRPPLLRPSGGDFHVSTLRFLAGQARRELDAHDRRAERDANAPAGARARLQRTAQITQQRLAGAQARRRNRPPG
ncbi:hypothetical protein [Conexibacter arvalis]|jgi:hypothetical protein|uniref:Uncharacterized protein n=1 Tax=Conexibacter arvalis TaxID=912552 RepID=A0A840IM62_9ACTN|nr:hypothetical protein [Conexibacter arvalis]MBB4665084.1 hypothetical protein [Conexibacter arvalis]